MQTKARRSGGTPGRAWSGVFHLRERRDDYLHIYLADLLRKSIYRKLYYISLVLIGD
jgi:hypothetical protein